MYSGRHEQKSRQLRATSSIVLALLTSFVVVTLVSPLLRWLLLPNVNALIALSVLAAFPCFALLASAMGYMAGRFERRTNAP